MWIGRSQEVPMQNTSRVFRSTSQALTQALAQPLRIAISASLVLILTGAAHSAQALPQASPLEARQAHDGPSTPATPIIPQQIRYTGKLPSRPGDTVEAEFRIYGSPEGSDPLWTETQRITIAEDGVYSVLLGSATPSGLPQAEFAGGAARWLGISFDQSPEQERVLLSSVPYAMKSADAESLSGHAVSDFVTQAQLAELTQLRAQPSTQPTQTSNAAPALAPSPITGSGTAGTIPLWTGTLTQTDSNIVQVGSNIGINELSPTAALDIGGSENVRGVLSLPPVATATATTGQRSQFIELSASGWSSTANAPVTPTFKLLTNFLDNDTSSATGQLELHFQQGAESTSVLSISGNGVITFAPKQTFPGTIASIATASPLSATTTSGAVTLGLNTSALETTLNAVYPQLASPINIFEGTQTAYDSAGPNTGAFIGHGTQGSVGLYGDSDTGYGVEGSTRTGSGIYGIATGAGFAGYFLNNTTSASSLYAENDASGSPGLGIAVKGYVSGSAAIGVLGKSIGNGSYGVLGENVGGTDSWGVYGNATGPGSAGVYGTTSAGPDQSGYQGAGVVGTSLTGLGVLGSSHGSSSTGSAFLPGNFAAGVWGDMAGIGTKEAQVGTGIFGTADDNYSGYFQNDASDFPTIEANNLGIGGAAIFQSASGTLATMGVENLAKGPAASMTSTGPSPTLSATNAIEGAGIYAGNESTTVAALIVENQATNSASAGYFQNDSSIAGTLNLDNKSTGGVGNVVGLFKNLIATTTTGTCGIGGNGDLSCTGQVKSLVPAGNGTRTVETYAMQSPENWMEDFGTGTLQRGVAMVKIDPAFAETVSNSADYHVFLTPRGDSRGLYVINVTPTSFEVRESGGGTSSLSFDYRVVARRRGYEAQRLRDVTESFNQAKARANQPDMPRLGPMVPSPQLQRKRRIAPAAAPGMSNAVKAALEAPETKLFPSHPSAQNKQLAPVNPASKP